jgi:two-component system, NarL family, sensor histidine kinase EvgS
VLRAWLSLWWGLLFLWASHGALANSPPGADLSYRFAVSAGPPPVALSPEWLTPEQQRYLATLPTLRVALQQVGAPPYERLLPEKTIGGLQAELLGQLARTLGIRLQPVVYPDWSSVLNAVREGQADIVLTIVASSERQRYLAFTLGTVPVPTAVFRRTGSAKVALGQARIALERDYYFNDIMASLYPAATRVQTQTTIEALRAVAEGRADAYVGSLLEALELLSATPVPGLEVEQILDVGPGFYRYGMRKELAPLADILNQGIASWRTLPGHDGELQRGVWQAATASGVNVPPPLVLSPDEGALLTRQPVWRVGAVRGLSLLNDVDATGRHVGIGADYTDQLVQRLGIVTEVVAFDSVADLLAAMRQGEVDIVPFLTRTEERAGFVSFSKPYVRMPYVLVGRNEGTLYWDLASLGGKRLALALGHPLRSVLAERHLDIQVVDVASGQEAMEAVLDGRADAAVEVKLFANLFINGPGDGRLRSLAEVDALPADFGFAVPRAQAALVPLIDRTLASIAPAEHERLYRRWVAVDLTPGLPWRRWAPTLAVGTTALLLLGVLALRRYRQQAAEVQRRRRADEQLDDIGRTIPGVVFRYVLDGQGGLANTFYSSGTEAFLGVRPERRQTLLQVLAPRLTPEARAEAERKTQLSLASGQRFNFTGAYAHPRGQSIWLHVEALRSTTAEGLTAWTGYVIDVTEQHDLQERYTREADERHVMLASASHELRTPAHTIAMALQSLPADGLPPQWQQPLGAARDAARTLGQLLDDVLDAARLDAGRLQLRPHAFDLHDLLAQLVSASRVLAQARGLAFESSVEPGVPRTLFGDPLRLKQVLLNLAANAVKYTPEGHVRLTARTCNLAGEPARLVLGVEDTGPGIDAAQQARLFEAFATVDSPGAPAPSSRTGLGLAICRRLVDLMGGEIQLRSAPGHGTLVEIWLPIQQLATDDRPLRQDGAILLCDDDPVSRLLMLESLRQFGQPVIEASSGEDALALWRHQRVRLLITDLNMTGMDGFSLVRSIRTDEAAAAERTAIVVCSGNLVPAAQGPEAAESPLDCDTFIVKPVSLDTLLDSLKALGIAAGGRAVPQDR